MVDLQIVRGATELAPPPLPLEHLIAKRFILSHRKFQSWSHGCPEVADGVIPSWALTSR
jgi:hypothetical protein